MLLEFRFRPFVLLPALTDDVRTAAKALTTSEDNKHLLEDAVAAYRVATLKEFFYCNEHCAGVGEIEVVRVALDDNAFQHPPLAMNQAIADGFSQGFVSGCLIQAAIALKFEFDGLGVKGSTGNLKDEDIGAVFVLILDDVVFF